MKSQQQGDARQLVEHFQRQQTESEVDTSETGINFLLGAGAKAEVMSAVMLRLDRTPADPYAGAVQIEVGCWDPSTRALALDQAEQWLSQHPAHHLVDYVQVRKDWLSQEVQHLKDVQAKQSLAQIFPGGALLLAAVCVAVIVRMLQKNAAPPGDAA